MAENQKSNTGSENQERKTTPTGTKNPSETPQGKAQGSPSNVLDENKTEDSRKNKEGNPDESKIQGEKNLEKDRSSDSDLERGERRSGGDM